MFLYISKVNAFLFDWINIYFSKYIVFQFSLTLLTYTSCLAFLDSKLLYQTFPIYTDF